MDVRYYLVSKKARMALFDSNYGLIRPKNNRLVYETSLKASQTVIQAWRMAINNRSFLKVMKFHSNRGVQYACNEFRAEIGNRVI
jgi:hypothetical protein